MGNVGMVWGWRVLSPSAPFTEGVSYDNYDWRKIVVMMTDGNSQFYKDDETAYGRLSDGVLGTTNNGSAKNILNQRMAETCALMKAKDKRIDIYTVIFTSSVDSGSRPPCHAGTCALRTEAVRT